MLASNDFIDADLGEWFAAALLFIELMVCGVVILRRCVGPLPAVDLVPLGSVLGLGAYTLGTNAVGYAIPIQAAFIAVLVLIASTALAVEATARWRARRSGRDAHFWTGLGIPKRGVVALVLASIVACATSTLATIRMFLYDDLAPSHIPAALQIVRGRFPVEEPGFPSADFAYHYAPDLLAAATMRLTDLPVWYAYDVQIAAFSLLMLPLAFTVARRMTRVMPAGAVTTSIFVAVLMVWGSPWLWTNFFHDPEVRKAFTALPAHPVHSLRWLGSRFVSIGELANGRTVNSVFATMHNHSLAMGYVAMLSTIYWLERTITSITSLRSREALKNIIPAILSLALLALCAETILMVMVPGVAVLVVLEAIRVRTWRPFLRAAAVVVPATIIIKLQGGALSDPIPYALGGPTFTWTRTAGSVLTFGGELRMTSWSFLREWLPYIVPATATVIAMGIVALRRGRESAAWMGLPVVTGAVVTGFATWLVPIVLFYTPSPFEAIRFFFPALVLFAGVSGVALGWMWGLNRWLRPVTVVFLGLSVISSVAFQAQYSLTAMGAVGSLGEDHVSPPRPPVLSAKPARLPIAGTKEDLVDLEFFWGVPDDTILISVGRGGVVPVSTLSGLQFQQPYFANRLAKFNNAVSNLDYDELADLGVDMIYVVKAVADAHGIDLSPIEAEPRFVEVHRSGKGADLRTVYALRS